MTFRDGRDAPARKHAPRRRARLLPRYTIRLRLAILYGGVFLVSGAVLLAIAYAGSSATMGIQSVAGPAAGVKPHRTVVLPRSTHSTAPAQPESAAVPPDVQAQVRELGSLAVHVHVSDRQRLLTWSVIALAIMALASMALGWVLAGRALRPLQAITSAARAISASNLHERLALKGPDDELRELGDTFDELLGRLESSFEAQRQFVANASHELRTPLTLERAILEVTLADPAASASSLRAACERVLAIGAQQEQTIAALLTLARSERGLAHRAPLLLDAVARQVIAERRDELDRRGLRLDVELSEAPTGGDARLIERLVANLLDNAIRHNTPGGWVAVTTTTDDKRAVLSVANSGAPIAPEEAERLAQPFHRHGADRIGYGDGHGLGLSIVSAIATAHGATLAVVPGATGGLRVEVKFPAASRASEPRDAIPEQRRRR